MRLFVAFFVFITLFLFIKPWKQCNSFNFTYLILILISLFATLWGHSLGILYAGLAALTIGIILFFRFGLKVLSIPELWAVGIAISIWGSNLLYNYMILGAKKLGFAFAYYTDPALLENFSKNNKFYYEPSAIEFLNTVFLKYAISLEMLFIIFFSSLVFFGKCTIKKNITESEYKWLCLFFIILLTVSFIMFAQVRFDNILISSAFIANFRYGFGLGIMSLILFIHSIQIIFDQYKILNKNDSKKFLKNKTYFFSIILIIFILANPLSTSIKNFLKHTVDNESIFSISLNNFCNTITNNGVRNILLDDRGHLYRCKNSTYIFTEEVQSVISAKDKDEFTAKLDDLEIDVILLYLPVNVWWENVRLYRFLERNWYKCSFDSPTVFYRKDLDEIMTCHNSIKFINW